MNSSLLLKTVRRLRVRWDMLSDLLLRVCVILAVELNYYNSKKTYIYSWRETDYWLHCCNLLDPSTVSTTFVVKRRKASKLQFKLSPTAPFPCCRTFMPVAADVAPAMACPHCRRKVRQSHFCETVSLFCDSVDRA